MQTYNESQTDDSTSLEKNSIIRMREIAIDCNVIHMICCTVDEGFNILSD